VIRASRCRGCGRVEVPPVDRCPACRAATDDHEVPPQGGTCSRARGPGRAPAGPLLVELGIGARVLARAEDVLESDRLGRVELGP